MRLVSLYGPILQCASLPRRLALTGCSFYAVAFSIPPHFYHISTSDSFTRPPQRTIASDASPTFCGHSSPVSCHQMLRPQRGGQRTRRRSMLVRRTLITVHPRRLQWPVDTPQIRRPVAGAPPLSGSINLLRQSATQNATLTC